MTGKLYLCATPIGNLGDITYRAVEMLRTADVIAAEDTRHTRGLLAHYDIHTPMTSYHEHNKEEKGAELIERLRAGAMVVCVSDAGLPGIADPGSHLAALAIEAGIDVSPLPGANAALSALICSGLDTRQFTFLGFLPRTAKKRRALLSDMAARRETLLFYEAPHHLKETLEELSRTFGEGRRAVAAREITKRYEEFRRGSLGELLAHYGAQTPRGEFVILVAGADGEPEELLPAAEETPVGLVARLMEEGLTKKEAMREAARRFHVGRREIYRAMLESGQ